MAKLVQQFVDSTALGSLYALFALGIALVFGVMKLINFAHGDLVMIGAFAALLLGDLAAPLMILGVVAATVLLAVLVERLAFRPVRSADPPTMLITSFAVSYFLRNAAALIFGSAPRQTVILDELARPVQIAGVNVALLSIVTITVTMVLLVAVGLVLQRTTIGLQLRASAEDFVAARLLGVRANVVIAAGFAMSGALAAVAAVLLVAQTGQVFTTMGATPVVVAFIATILGGLGSLRNAVLGGYLLGVATVLLQTYLPLEFRPYRDAFAYLLVILVLLVRPKGLFSGGVVGERI